MRNETLDQEASAVLAVLTFNVQMRGSAGQSPKDAWPGYNVARCRDHRKTRAYIGSN